MENIVQETICPKCHNAVSQSDLFCPHCGNELVTHKPLPSIGRQIGVYLVSFFLPPLGLWPAWKYFRDKRPGARKIAIIAVLLTVLSVLLTIWATDVIFKSVDSSLNAINSGLGL